MNSGCTAPAVMLIRGVLIALAWLTLTGAARLEMVARQDDAIVHRFEPLRGPIPAQALTVRRAGRTFAVRVPFALETGDVLSTGPGVVAMVAFPGVGVSYIDARSSVRIGSLGVQIGRVFARVKGAFSLESETIVAGVEGTSFVMEVRGRQGTSVSVQDGTVVCQSPSGAWAPLRLRGGQSFALDYRRGAAPRVGPTRTADSQRTQAWIDAIEAAFRGQSRFR